MTNNEKWLLKGCDYIFWEKEVPREHIKELIRTFHRTIKEGSDVKSYYFNKDYRNKVLSYVILFNSGVSERFVVYAKKKIAVRWLCS